MASATDGGTPMRSPAGRGLWILTLLLGLAMLLTLGGYLVYSGRIRVNGLLSSPYPVRGVDVSHYQGEIDWPLLTSQDIDFAFIKATEGRDYLDPRFGENIARARETGIRVGAYHYFTFTSSGSDQAQHYISVVPRFDGMLPPVIDLEMDAAKRRNWLEEPTVARELTDMLQALEAHYGIRPIIYTTVSDYGRYVRGRFDSYDLWIRNVHVHPALFGNLRWTFWQYSDKGQLQGYSGPERNIDLNVFSGSEDLFREYPPDA